MTESNEIKNEINDLPKSGLAEEILGKEQYKENFSDPERLFKFADTLKQGNAKDEKKDEQSLETWVFFLIDKEYFGLPVTNVQEILRIENITSVPHAPDVVRGITNMRGKVLPVVDMRRRLGLPEGEITNQSRILVVSVKERLFGLLVDAVTQVIRISEKKIQPPPPDIMTIKSDYIRGVYHLNDSLVIMLELDKVLHLN